MIRDHGYVSIHQSGTFHPPPNEPAALSRYPGDIYPATVRAYVDPLQSNLPYGPSIRVISINDSAHFSLMTWRCSRFGRCSMARVN
jgi:hypothetical protein